MASIVRTMTIGPRIGVLTMSHMFPLLVDWFLVPRKGGLEVVG